jgi:hypothetical protein
VSRPRKPSLREALDGRGNPAAIERLARAYAGSLVKAEARPEVLGAVRQVLAETPDASAAAMCRALPFRRQEVLAAVRLLRSGWEPVPIDGEAAS